MAIRRLPNSSPADVNYRVFLIVRLAIFRLHLDFLHLDFLGHDDFGHDDFGSVALLNRHLELLTEDGDARHFAHWDRALVCRAVLLAD